MPARRGQGGKAKAKASQPGRRVSGKQSLGGRLVKTLQKTKQREDKRQDKKEARVSGQFAKCRSTYHERTLKEERDPVFSKLAKHDSWMPKLAAMFRNGALEKLLSMEAEQSKQLADEELANENGVELGFRVKGRVTELFKLPKDTKARLLEDWFECNSFPDNEEDINVDWLNLVLSFVLHVSPKTNVPPVPNNRFEIVLSKQFELREPSSSRRRRASCDWVPPRARPFKSSSTETGAGFGSTSWKPRRAVRISARRCRQRRSCTKAPGSSRRSTTSRLWFTAPPTMP